MHFTLKSNCYFMEMGLYQEEREMEERVKGAREEVIVEN